MTEVTPIEERFASLMKAAQEGDGEAYATLMQELAGRLRQIVRHRRAFLQRADIEDLVQEILLSVHAVRATWDPAVRSSRGSWRSHGTGSPMVRGAMPLRLCTKWR